MSIFKAYDIRGVVPDELDSSLAYNIGRAFVTFVSPKVVAVGRDMRISSPEIFAALVKGITDQGADVVSIGLATTPMMYFAVAKYGYDAGINVTASHNPKQYNGMKMVTKDAVPLSGETGIKDIERLSREGKFEEPERKGNVIDKDVLQDYVMNVLSKADISKLKRFKVVVDTGNAMGGLVIPELFKHIPIDLVPLFMELDGNFPNHVPNPLEPENLRDLQSKVLETKADLGISIDGDSDRVFFVDNMGQIVPADLLGTRIAEMILEKHPGSLILYDLRSSMMVRETVEEAGGKAKQCRVGHSFIKAQMRKDKASFALELSAHYYMADNYYIESPYILILLLIKHLSDSRMTLSEYLEPLRKYHATGELNFKVKDKDEVLARVEKSFPDGKAMHLDGLSIEFDDWWFNLRPSNTEPLLRLNLEARSAETMENMKKKLLDMIQS